jgi:uncharacterized membrane protein
MAKPRTKPQHQDHALARILQARWRLLLAILLGVALMLFLPSDLRPVSRILVGWDAGVALYIMLVLLMIAGADTNHMRRESARQDEGRVVIPVLTVLAGLASLAAIMFWLRTTPESGFAPLSLALLFLTTLLSWAFIHIMFALHYAYEYYAEHRGKGGGLRFPGKEEPNYWDFLYLAFAIGTSTAVSDVQVTSRAIRQTVTAHGIVAFVFNVTLIALTVSIAADAIKAQ